MDLCAAHDEFHEEWADAMNTVGYEEPDWEEVGTCPGCNETWIAEIVEIDGAPYEVIRRLI